MTAEPDPYGIWMETESAGYAPVMSTLWNLLPPGVVKWAKAILAAVAAALNILFTTVPALESGRWAVWLVSVLAVIAVAVTPSDNARSLKAKLVADLRNREPVVLPSGYVQPNTPPPNLIP